MARLSATIAFALLSVADAANPSPFRHGKHARAGAPSFNTDLIKQNAISITNQSWEYGALTQAVIELETPELSVFSFAPFPPRTLLHAVPDAVWNVITPILDAEQPDAFAFIDGAGAAGDPSAIGPAVLLANTVAKNKTWAYDVQKQLNHLLYDVPHSPEGAISQRESEVQYWADAVYMMPPFLAYWGAITGGKNGTEQLKNAHLQCKLYREALFDADESLWHHIEGGSWQLHSLWATGNAWAAMGMVRVLATIRGSHAAWELKSEQQDLIDWVNEILKGSYKYQTSNGTIFNDINLPENQTFADAAGNSLITAAAYRLAAITGDKTYIPNAEASYELVSQSVDEEGWLNHAVNPLTFDTPLTGDIRSPEGQSFVLSLVAARKAYYQTL
ncbi:hypothetical protein PENSPDRAFT_683897 [Peniophora sp. CONT]|nr:hypothetical protein PENSPDRAFT_683897 [Peniophora sp. CONT]